MVKESKKTGIGVPASVASLGFFLLLLPFFLLCLYPKGNDLVIREDIDVFIR